MSTLRRALTWCAHCVQCPLCCQSRISFFNTNGVMYLEVTFSDVSHRGRALDLQPRYSTNCTHHESQLNWGRRITLLCVCGWLRAWLGQWQRCSYFVLSSPAEHGTVDPVWTETTWLLLTIGIEAAPNSVLVSQVKWSHLPAWATRDRVVELYSHLCGVSSMAGPVGDGYLVPLWL
jgi:hypothetical protein